MLLDFLIKINKRKLDKMITECYNYDNILKQSQKIDFYINIWMRSRLKVSQKVSQAKDKNLYNA